MSAQVAGRYDLLREIGSGAMGRVFEAVDTETGQHVAVKILIAGNEVDVQSLLRFQQEGMVLSTLKHPNIVQVHATYLEAGMSSIIMELLEGRSLGQLLRAETLPLARTRHIMQQVASALAYAHSRGIIHRDVKPDNIMVVGDDQVKVTDFGIARVLRDSAPFGTLTATGATLGTPWYMSPEQIEGAKVDGRSDIYSFGAVLYQMVTGKPPFDGSDPVTVAFQHVHKAAEPPGNLNPAVPRDWEALILTCLAKDPNDRYQTAGALSDALVALNSSAHQAPRQQDEAETAAHNQEARALIERARRKELSEDLAGAWRDYRAALTIASPGPVRDELNASISRVEARMDEPAAPTGPAIGEPDAVVRANTGEPPAPTESQPLPGTPQAATLTPARNATGDAKHPARSRRTALLAGVGTVIAAGIAGLVLFRLMSSTAAPAIKLTVSGRRHGRLYSSGQTVQLHWTQVSHASDYRLEVATRNSDPTDATVFGRPSITALDRKDTYALHVVGRQFYYWRVQPEVGSTWDPYVHSIHFLVGAPSIAVPFPLSPPNNAYLTTSRVRLCWSLVKGAAGYDLRVVGATVANLQTSTCARLSAHPGNYSWHVAARVRGARVYTGAYSQPSFFTVNAPPTSTPQPLPTAISAPTAAPAVAPRPTAVPRPTTAPRPTAKPKHHRGTRKPRATRPTPAPRPTPTARPTITARPTATPHATPQTISFAFNRLFARFPGRKPRHSFAENQPFVVVLAFTVHNLPAGHTVQAGVVRNRLRQLPSGGFQLVRTSTLTVAAHNGRNVFRYTTRVKQAGTFHIVVKVTIGGRTRSRFYSLTVP